MRTNKLQLAREFAWRYDIPLDDVCAEDVERVRQQGWSVSISGQRPYCLSCGLQLAESLDELKGRKRCGECRSELKNTAD